MKPVDPYSLDRMVDIVTLPPVRWWPPAVGWYFIAALLVLWIGVGTTRAVKRYRSNAYRRQALRELDQIHTGDFASLSSLMKRVALVSFPSETVAGLVGMPWIDFIGRTCPQAHFDPTVKGLLANASSRVAQVACEASSWRNAVAESRKWIRDHQADKVQ
ncbi:MAG: DUF4381 domain-containing protein [Planctomycetota bacterium]